MDQIEGGITIPVVGVCLHERLGEFKLIRYGTKEDTGMSYVVGNLILVPAEVMEHDALGKILEALNFYRIWPAKTKLESEIGVMHSRQLSKFVADHKFVDVLKRDNASISVRPSHRTGRSWKGVTAYMNEEIRLALPLSQGRIFKVLTKAFGLAT